MEGEHWSNDLEVKAEGGSHENLWGNSISEGKKSRSKGLEMGACLVHQRARQEVWLGKMSVEKRFQKKPSGNWRPDQVKPYRS